MTSVLYAVGAGAAVATDGAWLLTDQSPTAQVVRDVWTQLGAGLEREEILPALSSAGLSDVRSFALVLSTEPALVVVHGAARVLLEGPDGSAVVDNGTTSSWVEAALPAGTTAATLLLTESDAGADARIPAAAGVFPCSALVVRWAPRPPATLPPLVPPRPSTPPPVIPPRPSAAPPVVPPVPTAPPPTSEADEEPTEVLAPSVSSPDSFFDQEALPNLPVTAVAPPRPAGSPPSAPVRAGHGVLRISNGDEVVLDRGAVLGRSPEWHGSDERHLVTVVGQFGDVSRSHVSVSLDGDRVRVEDLGSTNGTLVTQPGAPQHLLQVGVAETLEPGAVVTLSRDVSFSWETDPR
ncbi:MAG TPA: FHA domain-containing protein [Mycobacteriales bacterium]